MAKNLGGRPTKKTEETVKKLEDIFKNGANVQEACSYAGISKETYYTWLETDESFLTKMESAQYYPVIAAKNILLQDIYKNKNIDSAKWYLERKAKKEFSLRQELTGEDGKDLPTPIIPIKNVILSNNSDPKDL